MYIFITPSDSYKYISIWYGVHLKSTASILHNLNVANASFVYLISVYKYRPTLVLNLLRF